MLKNRVCATDRGLPRLTRRAFFAAPALSLLPAIAMAAEADPVLPLYQDWLDARREWRHLASMPGNENFDRPDSIAAEDREAAAFALMVDLTPTSNAGFAAFAHILWDIEGPTSVASDPDYADQLSVPTSKLIAAIWRAFSDQHGVPEVRYS